MKAWNAWRDWARENLALSARDLGVAFLYLALACLAGLALQAWAGADADAAPLFILAVALIARATRGYAWGPIAAVLSVFLVNTFYTYPRGELNFSIPGYPVTFLVMLLVAVMTSVLTHQLKREMNRAQSSERQARELLKRNQRLSSERERMEIEAEREKLRGDLLRAMSHDLRTPLTAIYGASSAILQGGDRLSEQERERLLLGIGEDAQWLIRMVENLLTITRVAGGGANLHKRDEVAEEIMAEAAAKVRKRYPEKRVRVQAPEELLIAPMDPMLIEQVLINLLENAAVHADSAQEIQLTAQRAGDTARFAVRDFGRGIDEADLPRLFEGLGRRGADSRRGMGIGLSACQAIVRAHGGELEARNAPDGGAVFSFALPLRETTGGEE